MYKCGEFLHNIKAELFTLAIQKHNNLDKYEKDLDASKLDFSSRKRQQHFNLVFFLPDGRNWNRVGLSPIERWKVSLTAKFASGIGKKWKQFSSLRS